MPILLLCLVVWVLMLWLLLLMRLRLVVRLGVVLSLWLVVLRGRWLLIGVRRGRGWVTIPRTRLGIVRSRLCLDWLRYPHVLVRVGLGRGRLRGRDTGTIISVLLRVGML